MAAKVSYKQGTKQTYLGLEKKLDSALYFCTDTKELFKGNDLYSDGLRIIAGYSDLPAFAVAADGIVYFCEDSGCGYVLNTARNAWLQVIYGVDNATIGINENGLLAVKAVGITSVTGLTDELQRIEALVAGGAAIATKETAGIVKPGIEFEVSSDGTLSLNAVSIEKVTGLSERLSAVESAAVGGVHYRGSVATYDDLPADAKQGDLYEVSADNSEWCFNGSKWFEYGKTTDIDLSGYAKKDEVHSIARMVNYEVSHKPAGTLVNYSDEEIRVMCPADTQWTLQNSGETADENAYYIGFKAYAPDSSIVSFKEDLGETISDNTMNYFEDNDFAGIDEYGRKYSIIWLPVAMHDAETDTWTYYGSNSTAGKYIGWYYTVEWYNADSVKVAADTIRINLSNENCHLKAMPFYAADMQSSLAALAESLTWDNI